MKQVFVFNETKEAVSILNKTYPDLLAALKHKSPQAQELAEDNELCQLHDLLLLLKMKRIRVQWGNYDHGQRFLALEVVA